MRAATSPWALSIALVKVLPNGVRRVDCPCVRRHSA